MEARKAACLLLFVASMASSARVCASSKARFRVYVGRDTPSTETTGNHEDFPGSPGRRAAAVNVGHAPIIAHMYIRVTGAPPACQA